MNEEARRRLTPEELLDEIHDLARNGDDANKRWALKMLSSQESSLSLPEPLTRADVIERLMRIMRATGMAISQMAWNKAFAGTHKRPTDEAVIADHQDLVPPEVANKIKRITRVRNLYDFAPDIRKPGVPVGFPRNGKEAQARFLQGVAMRIAINRVKAGQDPLTGKSLEATDGTVSQPAETVQNLGN